MKNESREAGIEARIVEFDLDGRDWGQVVSPADLRYLLDRNRDLEALALGLARAMESVSAYFDTESENDCPSGCKLTEDVSTSCEYQPILDCRMKIAKEALAVDGVAALLSKAAKSQEKP